MLIVPNVKWTQKCTLSHQWCTFPQGFHIWCYRIVLNKCSCLNKRSPSSFWWSIQVLMEWTPKRVKKGDKWAKMAGEHLCYSSGLPGCLFLPRQHLSSNRRYSSSVKCERNTEICSLMMPNNLINHTLISFLCQLHKFTARSHEQMDLTCVRSMSQCLLCLTSFIEIQTYKSKLPIL